MDQPAWTGPYRRFAHISADGAASSPIMARTSPIVARGTPAAWPAQTALLLAVVWPLAIVTVFAPLAIRRHTRA